MLSSFKHDAYAQQQAPNSPNMESRMKLNMSVLLMVLLVSSCTWVKLSQEANNIELKNSGELAACQRVGVATAQTKSNIWFYQRDQETVAEEALTLARNEAVKMGGNTLISMGELVNGRQQFAVYLCK